MRLASLTPLAQTEPYMNLDDKTLLRSSSVNNSNTSYRTRAGRNLTSETH